jgi:murein L,D-transpeptidase YcbB/YkuD
VEAFTKNKSAVSMKAIVGMSGRRTPLFKALMKNVIFHPSWGVPVSIAVKDKLSKIQSDPDYLNRSGYTVTDESGIVVDPFQVSWEGLSLGYFPYHLRQKPGKYNALGQIKFDIDLAKNFVVNLPFQLTDSQRATAWEIDRHFFLLSYK